MVKYFCVFYNKSQWEHADTEEKVPLELSLGEVLASFLSAQICSYLSTQSSPCPLNWIQTSWINAVPGIPILFFSLSSNMLWLAVSTAAGWLCRDFYLKTGDWIWAYNCSFEMCLGCLAADFRACGSTFDRRDRMAICRNQKHFGKSLLAEYQENKRSI